MYNWTWSELYPIVSAVLKSLSIEQVVAWCYLNIDFILDNERLIRLFQHYTKISMLDDTQLYGVDQYERIFVVVALTHLTVSYQFS